MRGGSRAVSQAGVATADQETWLKTALQARGFDKSSCDGIAKLNVSDGDAECMFLCRHHTWIYVQMFPMGTF